MPEYYQAVVFKNDVLFMAHCLELGITSNGETFQEALNKLRQDVWAHLKTSGQPDIPFDEVRVSIMRTEVELQRDEPNRG